MAAGSVIVGGARTPFGKLLGSLASVSATDLGGYAIAAARGRAGIRGALVDGVILGLVLLAGCGLLPARQAAVHGGIPLSVPWVTII
jgi:acetyl-CoA C-acetyltransferase